MKYSKEIYKSFLRFTGILTVLVCSVACERQSVVSLPNVHSGYDYDWFQLDRKELTTANLCFPKVFLEGLIFLQSNYPNGKYMVHYDSKNDKVIGSLQPICNDAKMNFVSKVCLIVDNGNNPHNICVSQ